jgi:DNA modification methylase
MSKSEIETSFPNLKNCSYSIASPSTVEYNCIAWAAGDNEAWWWPDANNQYYWPDGVPRNESLEAFINVFELMGYTICDTYEYEKGIEKIAIYVDSTRKPTHASRQLNSGSWTSKLGSWVDIEHDLDGISGSEYGSIAVFMKRTKRNDVF